MGKELPQVTTRSKGPDLHARIKQVEREREGEKYVISRKNSLLVHFAENDEQWEQGVIRIEIDGKQAEVSIDALMSTIFTAYDPRVLKQVAGILENIKIRVYSWFLSKKKK